MDDAPEPHTTPLMRDSISPLMDISISAQLPRFDLNCRKRSSAACLKEPPSGATAHYPGLLWLAL